MKNRLPQIFSGSRICIICEGDEEYEYLDKLISLEVWNKNYEFVLESHKKNKNAPLICALTGVENYKGRADQRQALFSMITKENYQEMQKRINKLSSDDKKKGSSNFGYFVERFTSDDNRWIQEINDAIEDDSI